MKRIIVLMAIIIVIFSGSVSAAPEVTVKVDGRLIEFTDAQPFLADGRTHVPTRFIAEQLGATLDWKESTKTVTITKNDINITLRIGEKKATVNGEEKKLDTQIFLKDSRTYAPVRFVAETLGAAVAWNSETSTVLITTETIPEGKPMLEEVAKKIDGAIIPERSNGDIVLFKADGKANFGDCDLFIDFDNEKYHLSLKTYKDTTLQAAKEVIKIYFPENYEVVHKQITKVVNGAIGPLGVWDYKQWHDNRLINIKKYENSVGIIIGQKGVEY